MDRISLGVMVAKIKVSEVFYSLQGEGRFVGVPSVFLRTYGCNFRCAGFGCKPGESSTGADEVAKTVELYKTFNDLPLVETGCDSYASWHPAFKHLSPTQTTEELVARMLALTPNNRWVQNNGNDVHLVITGGEPLLGWQRAYSELLSHPDMADLKNITFETNGTQELQKDFRHFLLDWTLNSKFGKRGTSALTFSVSAKLGASGESWEEAIRPDVVMSYAEIGHTYLKFVVETDAHIHEAIRATDEFRAAGFTGPVYLMPQGGLQGSYEQNLRSIADICVAQGFNLSPRLHCSIWGNGWAR
jgi:7-carboxy-7-deazaguanine synthase